MHRTRVKICGITRPQDALDAAEAGADAIGMILHADAPRKISLETAREIVNLLPSMITPVGVFVDAEPKLIIEIARSLGLRHVQLHGHESPEIVAELRDFTVIKAIRPKRDLESELRGWTEAQHSASLSHVKAILIETARTPQGGGTGIESDWDQIARLRASMDWPKHVHFIAAGGLTPGNVAKVIEHLHPWAVDASSGVEESMGVKSAEKMRAFCTATAGFSA